jgi:hypothetical protein
MKLRLKESHAGTMSQGYTFFMQTEAEIIMATDTRTGRWTCRQRRVGMQGNRQTLTTANKVCTQPNERHRRQHIFYPPVYLPAHHLTHVTVNPAICLSDYEALSHCISDFSVHFAFLSSFYFCLFFRLLGCPFSCLPPV